MGPAGVLASIVAACALAVTAAPAAARVCPYPGTVGGVGVLVYCGSAKATARVGAKTSLWKNGQCKRLGSNFYVNFGSIVTQQVKKAPDSFQIIAGSDAKPAAKDGSYSGTTVMMNKGGVNYLADALTLTLTHDARAGTLTGTIAPSRGGAKAAFHATFTC